MIKILGDNTHNLDSTAFFVTISELYSTSNVGLFMANCKTIIFVYYLVTNIQDNGRKPEVQITFL